MLWKVVMSGRLTQRKMIDTRKDDKMNKQHILVSNVSNDHVLINIQLIVTCGKLVF